MRLGELLRAEFDGARLRDLSQVYARMPVRARGDMQQEHAWHRELDGAWYDERPLDGAVRGSCHTCSAPILASVPHVCYWMEAHGGRAVFHFSQPLHGMLPPRRLAPLDDRSSVTHVTLCTDCAVSLSILTAHMHLEPSMLFQGLALTPAVYVDRVLTPLSWPAPAAREVDLEALFEDVVRPVTAQWTDLCEIVRQVAFPTLPQSSAPALRAPDPLFVDVALKDELALEHLRLGRPAQTRVEPVSHPYFAAPKSFLVIIVHYCALAPPLRIQPAPSDDADDPAAAQ